jgi:MarR family
MSTVTEPIPNPRAIPDFRLLTNHGNTLLLIARDQRIRIRDIASLLDITERAAQRIVADLVATGYLVREREGRRNLYQVKSHLTLRLPFQQDLDIKSLLAIMATPDDPSGARSAKRVLDGG